MFFLSYNILTVRWRYLTEQTGWLDNYNRNNMLNKSRVTVASVYNNNDDDNNIYRVGAELEGVGTEQSWFRGFKSRVRLRYKPSSNKLL